MKMLFASSFFSAVLLLFFGCMTAPQPDLRAAPWGPASVPRQYGAVSLSVETDKALRPSRWTVFLKSPENLVDFSYDDYYTGNSIELDVPGLQSLDPMLVKFQKWNQQIQTQGLNVRQKDLGSVPCRLRFNGGGYNTSESAGSVFVVPIDLNLSLKTREGVVYLAVSFPATGMGVADPTAVIPGHTYWLTPDEAVSLESLIGPGFQDRFRSFFADRVPVSSVAPIPTQAPRGADDADRLTL